MIGALNFALALAPIAVTTPVLKEAVANAGDGFVQGVTGMLSGVTTWFTSVFSSIGAMLYDSTASNLTTLGYLVCIPVAIGLVTFGIKFIMKLVSKIKA